MEGPFHILFKLPSQNQLNNSSLSSVSLIFAENISKYAITKSSG